MTWAGPLFGASAALALLAGLGAALLPRSRQAAALLPLCFLGLAGSCLALGSGFVFILIVVVLVVPVPAALLAAMLLAPPGEPDRRERGRAAAGLMLGALAFLGLAVLLSRSWPPAGGALQTSADWLGSRLLTDYSLVLLLAAAALALAAMGAVALLRPRRSGR